MALTRKFLKAMGIEDEKVDQIIEEHVEVKNDLNAKLEEAQQRAKDAEDSAKQVAALQKELEELKAGGKDDTELTKLREEYEQYKAQVEGEKSAAEKRELYRNALIDAGIDQKRIKTVMRCADLDSFTVKDGAIEDMDKLMDSIKENWADFITTKQQVGAQVDNPPANNPSSNVNSLVDALMEKYN